MGGVTSSPYFRYTNPVGLTWAGADLASNNALSNATGGKGNTVLKDVGLQNAAKTPPPPGAVPSATTDSAAVQQALAEATQRRNRARGFQSTILSQNFLSPDSSTLKSTFGS